MISRKATILACGASLAVVATSAHASLEEYTVPPGSNAELALNVCSSETQLAVRGDTGTDLDFVLADSDGTVIHTDEGIDDYISILIAASGEECETFALDVANLGDEPNDFTVLLEPVTTSSIRVEKHIIQPSETRALPFKACGIKAELTARGDGDTDLDFLVRNADGSVVHEDAATSDTTSVTLAGLLSDCETFEIEVSNLGSVYNALMLVVAPEGAGETSFSGTPPSSRLVTASESDGDDLFAGEAVEDDGSVSLLPPDTASTDGNNRTIAILNRTGEPLTTIAWTNAATIDWGDSRLPEGDSLASGQQWNVNVHDGSDACIFDFLGETESEREIERRGINVCEVVSVTFE